MSGHFIAIGGPPGTGKTLTCITAPRPVGIIYGDRPRGDSEIQGLEDMGIHVYNVDLNNPRENALAQINKVRADIKVKGLKSVVYDGLAFSQTAQQGSTSGHNRNSMNLKKNGIVSNSIADILDAMLGLNGVHVVLTFHIREEPIKDGDKTIGTIWRPVLMPQVTKILEQTCGLIGYNWKRPKADGTGNDYGTCFLEQIRGKNAIRQFQCAKSPEGWGANEVPNIAAWIDRFDRQAAEKGRAKALAILGGATTPPPAEDTTTAPDETPIDDNRNPEIPE